jgi:hypothetical protein
MGHDADDPLVLRKAEVVANGAATVFRQPCRDRHAGQDRGNPAPRHACAYEILRNGIAHGEKAVHLPKAVLADALR